MQFSLPSGRRAARFLVVFYAATALLFFGFYAVLDFFGGLSYVTAYLSVTWPAHLVLDEFQIPLLVIGLATAFVEPRVMEVGN